MEYTDTDVYRIAEAARDVTSGKSCLPRFILGIGMLPDEIREGGGRVWIGPERQRQAAAYFAFLAKRYAQLVKADVPEVIENVADELSNDPSPRVLDECVWGASDGERLYINFHGIPVRVTDVPHGNREA